MKPSVGAIHEAAFLFGGSPRIKKRQDIAPTDGSSDLLFVESYLHSATPFIIFKICLKMMKLGKYCKSINIRSLELNHFDFIFPHVCSELVIVKLDHQGEIGTHRATLPFCRKDRKSVV